MGENFAKNLQMVDVVKEIAVSKNAAPGQVALAWLLARGADIAPIPGTKRVKYLDENAAAAEITLSPGEMARLDALGAQTSGPRYGESGLKMVER